MTNSASHDTETALREAIAALQAQRGVLGGAVVDAALAPLLQRLGPATSGLPAAADRGGPMPPPAPQLRLVTVLFLDMVGSTAMSQRLDPECVHEVLDGALAAYTAQVQRQGGTVLQYAGDSLLAVFGHPRSSEDDAERAVRTALALLAEARQQGVAVQQLHALAGLDVRVGIHTGRVLLGAGVDGKHGIRGMTVNIAARLEQAAAPGTVLISHETWRLVEGLFDCEPLPPLHVKGCDEPLAAWRVCGGKPPGQAERRRGIDGVASPFTGRDSELSQLLQAWDMVSATRPQAWLVLAEAGLGKSRLAAEFLQNVEALDRRPALLLQARAQAAQQLQPYRLLRDLLARWLAIADSDETEVARQRFESGLRPWLGDGDEALAAVHRLGQLLGLDYTASPWVAGADARALRDWGLQAFEAVLTAVASGQRGPVLVVADDLHWADAASVQALLRLLPGGGAPPVPLMLLGLARPHAGAELTALAGSAAAWATLELAPLSPAEGSALVGTLLQHLQPMPERLAEELAARAAGNPYYLEELVKMLFDHGVLEQPPAPAPWRYHPERLDATALPSTLAGVLQARMDALPPLARRALQQASVIGAVFWDDALAYLDADASLALPELERKALVRRRALSTFEGTVEEQFAHQLLQQASYDSVLRGDRQSGHAAAARWLAQRAGGRSAEHLAATAGHFLAAGEREDAAHWFFRAALHAAQRYDNATALALVAQGLQSVPPTGPEPPGAAPQPPAAARLRWPLLYQQMLLADRVGDRALQESAVRGLETLAESAAAAPAAAEADTAALQAGLPLAGPSAWAAAALLARATLAYRLGSHEQGYATLEVAIALAEAAGQRALAAECCNLATVLGRVLGQGDAVRAQVAAGLAHARATGHRGVELRLQTNLAALDHAESRHARARRAMTALLPLAHELNQPVSELVLLVNLTGCCIELADAQAVLDLAPQAIRLAEALGERVYGAVACMNLAEALHIQGHLPEAVQQVQAALQALRGSHSALFEAYGEHNLAQMEQDLGLPAEAARRYADAALRFAELGQPTMVADTHAMRARSLLTLGDREGARAALSVIVDEPVVDDPLDLPLCALWATWDVLTGLGDPAASAWLQHAGQALQRYLAHFDDEAEARRFLHHHTEAGAIAAACAEVARRPPG